MKHFHITAASAVMALALSLSAFAQATRDEAQTLVRSEQAQSIVKQAAQTDARSNGERAVAGKSPDEYAAAMQLREGAESRVRVTFPSPAHNAGPAGGSFGPAVNNGVNFAGATRGGR